jgi:hypothetical protein
MRQLFVTLLGSALLLTGCASFSGQQQITDHPRRFPYAPLELQNVAVFDETVPVPFNYVPISSARIARGADRAQEQQTVFAVRTRGAERGAHGVYRRRLPNGDLEVLAVWLADVRYGQWLKGTDPSADNVVDADGRSAGQASRSATPASGATERTSVGGSSGGCVGSCPVNVRGYRRKDGTYVKPHRRSAPGTKSSGGRRRS